MGLYIIGDLHLSFSSDKPMDVFGVKWGNHHLKIKNDWLARVGEDDTVILAGDTSWASNLEEAKIDLAWIDALPGKKIILKGNHDYWWTTLKKMTGLFKTICFLHNNAYTYDGLGIVGTRGWEIPNDNSPLADGVKVFNRECMRLQLSIDQLPKHFNKIAVLHYPPFDDRGNKSEFNYIIEKNNIEEVYFGHIHSNYKATTQGVIDNVNYQLISCDYLDFKLKKIR